MVIKGTRSSTRLSLKRRAVHREEKEGEISERQPLNEKSIEIPGGIPKETTNDMGKDTEVNESGMTETSAKIPEETANDMGKDTESKESGGTA